MPRYAIVLILLVLIQNPAATAADPVLEEWVVPWGNTRPRDPDVAPNAKIWFGGQAGDYIANFDPETQKFEKIALESGTGPHNLIVGDDGTVWYAGNRAAHIGKVDPASGNIKKIMMPNEEARDPHTLIFDQAGDIWFTVQGGNFVGKLDVESEWSTTSGKTRSGSVRIPTRSVGRSCRNELESPMPVRVARQSRSTLN